MYALITDGSIAKYLSGNRGITIGDIHYARDIYSKWTAAERNAIGIFEVIQKSAKKFNQRIIVITFNLKEDLEKKPSWRYDFIKNLLTEKDITHIDSLQIMKNKSDEYDEKIENYFGSDAHNNKKSFEYIFDEFLKIYKAI